MNKARRPDTGPLRCTRCGERKPRDAFALRINGRPHSWCRQCKREHDAQIADHYRALRQ